MTNTGAIGWVDVLDDGSPFERNKCIVFDGSDVVDATLRDLPHGLGCGVYDLGQQPAFVESLMGGAFEGAEVVDALLGAMPGDAPRTCRIQLGLADARSMPVLQDSPNNRSVVLSVWGHDPQMLASLRGKVDDALEASNETETSYTVDNFVASKLSEQAAEASRAYRQGIAKSAIDTLSSGFCVTAPDEIFSTDGARVYDSHNFELVGLTPCLDNKVAVASDANVGTEAIVFHSPQRGSTMYLSGAASTTSIPSHAKLSIVPGSDGRTISFAPEQAGAISDRIARATKMIQPDDRTVACKLSASGNNFQGVDTLEATYCAPLPLKAVKPIAETCEHVVHIKSLVTALPPVQHSNAKLHGVVECDTIDAVLAHTSPDSTHVILPNSEAWRHTLTEADPDNRPFAYMNDKTQVKCSQSGRTIAWRIPRTELN